MRTQLKICTEADYLQAHLTVIDGEFRGRSPALRILKQHVTSVVKKWMFEATANLASLFNSLLKLRAIRRIHRTRCPGDTP